MTATIHAPDFRAPSAALPAERVGCVVWWSATDIQADPGSVRDALAADCPKHADLVREPPSFASAMRRAIRRRQAAVMLEGCRWEEVSDDATGLRVALAQSERAEQVFRASTRFTVLVDHQTGDIACSRPAEPGPEREALQALVARYRIERGQLTAMDFRVMLVAILLRRSRGVRLKDGGAVYFVPAPDDLVIDQLQSACALANIDLLRFPVLSADGYAVAQLAGPVQAGVAFEVAQLRSEVEAKLHAVTVQGKGARFESVAARLEEAEALRSKARLFEHLIGADMRAVLSAVDDAERLVRETMDALSKR